MELIDNRFRWDTDGGDEELSARFNDNVGKLVEPAFGVVMANESELISSIRKA